MKKETFIAAIEAIEKQLRYDIEVGKKLGEAFPHANNLMPDNHFLQDALFQVLQEEMCDDFVCEHSMSWIEWYCFETDFGKENWRLKAYEKDGTIIPMNNAGELYDYLIKNKIKC